MSLSNCLNQVLLIMDSMLKLDTCKISVQLHTFIYVFLSQLIFIFSLLLDMVMYANEFETKEKQKVPEMKN